MGTPEPGEQERTAADELIDLANALRRRVASAPGEEREARANALRGHVEEYLLPRALDLDAPLLVVILGSTGSGKSSLLNALAGAQISPSGVLRPTTRRPIALIHPDDRRGRINPIADRLSLDLRTDSAARRRVVLVDAPDFDSDESENRDRAMGLLEVADLVIFVSTATRYADRVPWEVLRRVRQRGVPMLAVLNRLPSDAGDAAAVLDHFRTMLERSGLIEQGAVDGALEIVPVGEGAVDRERDALQAEAIEPVRAAVDRLVESGADRREVVAAALHAGLRAIPKSVEPIAAQIEEEQEAVAELRRVADRSYETARAALADELGRGTFLRAEVLRQWHDFIGAGQVARFLSEGIGRITATVRSVVRPGPPPPAAEVRAAAFADLVALAVQHADTAAQRTAATWATDRYGSLALAADEGLWRATPELSDRLTRELELWAVELGGRIRQLGGRRKGVAQIASLGVNVMGTSAVLAVFVSTGGLTGTEVGITAATAVVNQKLLEAVFGEANVRAFVARGRDDLRGLLEDALADERRRYDEALGETGDPALAADLRHAAARVGRLVPAA